MKVTSRSISKSHVLAALKAMGLTAERKMVDGKRAWFVSDGKSFDGLRDLVSAYKISQ